MSKRRRRRNEKQRRHRQLVPSRRQVAKAGGVAVGASLITGVAAAQADTFTVDNLSDTSGQACTPGAPNDCSFFSALENNDANTNSPTVDVINFESGLSGTIDTYGLFTNEPVDIQGPGADQIIVHEYGGPDAPVFVTNQNNTGDPVTVSGLTFEHGDYSGIVNAFTTLTLNNVVVQDNGVYTASPPDFGGGIYTVFGDTTVNSSTVQNNFAYQAGGGMGALFSTNTVNDSTVTGNNADDLGGGIASAASYLTVNDSTISGNGYPSTTYGGGIYSYKYQPVIQGTTLSGNYAIFGGGMFQRLGPGPTIQNSTIEGNLAIFGGGLNTKYGGADVRGSTFNDNYGFYGGGFYSPAPYYPISFSNSTLAGNQAYRTGAGGSFYTNDSFPFTFSDVTVAGNTTTGSPTFGGGLASFVGDGPAPSLRNAIVSGNTASDGPDLYGPFDAAFTLVRNTGGAAVNTTVPGSNLFGVDPLLGGLASNGGPTQTMGLPQSSPAVDKGSSSAGSDQRGSPRPFDFASVPNSTAAGANGADMGAFELAGTNPLCKGKPATIAGTGAPGTITGTNQRDVIVGTNTNEKINSRGGNDLVCAKGGKDTVNGGGGKDKLFGQGGKDKLLGKGGKDKLVGGAKKDTLKGGAGNDNLKGGGGKDRLVGQGGRDKLIGGGGNDTCVGGPGKDTEKSC